MPLRVAFTGVSHWHLDLYLPVVLGLPDVEVVGVSDPNTAVAERVGTQVGCAFSASSSQLLDRTTPDFVFVLGTHADMYAEGLGLIERGIGFMMEKPCGTSLAQVADLAEKCEAAHVHATIPFVWRRSEMLEALRERFADETIGYLLLRWIAGAPQRYIDSGCGWMLDPGIAGGGCTLNLGVHLLDLARVLLGPAVQVTSAVMSNAGGGYPVEDYALIVLQDGARTATLETGYLLPAGHSTFDLHFAVASTNGYAASHGPDTMRFIDNAGSGTELAVKTTNVPHYPRYVIETLERFRSGAEPIATMADMAAVMGLAQDAYRIAGW